MIQITGSNRPGLSSNQLRRADSPADRLRGESVELDIERIFRELPIAAAFTVEELDHQAELIRLEVERLRRVIN